MVSLNLTQLASRQIRQAAVGNSGVRRIAISATNTQNKEDGGILSVYNAVEKFGRSLMSFAFARIKDFLSLDWGKLFQQISGGVMYLLNFNINISDTEIDEKIKQAEIALAGAKGSLAGQSLGFAICGVVPAATVAVFNEPLGLYMMKELGEEAADEIAGSLATLVSLQIQQSARKTMFQLFKNNRALCRTAALGVANLLVKVGYLTQESVDKANKDRNKPWSIASAHEESIDSIQDPEDKAYAENFWDEFGEACIEAGYIVANSADSYFAMQKMANQAQFGSEKVIEIQPIRNADDEDE
ncbi:hypothetical protein [Aliterella atlantica]|uniref:Uncharacterized protein n=1 Tax=Aliterella atlantica CENA595 TaxID=1618023 RepID=A0A0D8ZQB7_9CYAN|nr:hypothetical protein [Aliterella atlantica]KJH69396.1 hypothetical protein UH38_24135 [Aliterella atlantica CENA595]